MKAIFSFRLEQTRANGIKSRDGKKINEMKSVQITACFRCQFDHTKLQHLNERRK